MRHWSKICAGAIIGWRLLFDSPTPIIVSARGLSDHRSTEGTEARSTSTWFPHRDLSLPQLLRFYACDSFIVSQRPSDCVGCFSLACLMAHFYRLVCPPKYRERDSCLVMNTRIIVNVPACVRSLVLTMRALNTRQGTGSSRQ